MKMGVINIGRLQSIHRISVKCLKNSVRNVTTKPSPVENSNVVKKISWGIGGAIVATGLTGALSSKIMLEAEKPSPQEGKQKLAEFNQQTSALQNDQCKLSRENPGLFLWGANECGIAAPNNVKETPIKFPRKLNFFEGQALRGVVFGTNHAVAIDANGDLYQWGLGYFGDEIEKNADPEITLKGKDIVQVAASDKKVFALSGTGELFVISASKKYQEIPKEQQVQSWGDYLWGVSPSIKFFKAEVPNLAKGEKIRNISAGQHHMAAITNTSRILTLQADAEGKMYGQLGISDLETAPTPSTQDDFEANFCLKFAEVKLPDFVNLDKVSCGNNHTFIRTNSGRVFAFGANFSGQLGTGNFTLSRAISLTPQEVTTKFVTSNLQLRPIVVDVAAGGDTSAFVIQQVDFNNQVKSVEVYTCGFGQWGQLGNNRYMHAQGEPVKVSAFSSKFEYSEELKRTVPVNVYKMSIGGTHLFATLNNEDGKSEFGRDVYAWGENTDFQLGTGKRNNLSSPAFPLLPGYFLAKGLTDSEIQSALQGRLQAASPSQVSICLPGNKKERKVQVEQEIVAGFGVSAMYSKIIL